MLSPSDGTIPYLAAVQLAHCAIQLRAEHQRAEDGWQAERAGLQTTIEQLQKELDRLRTEFAVCGDPVRVPLAVHRVFAIPELLEQILLRVPHFSRSEDYRTEMEGERYDPQRPIVQLFAMQRVNRQFAATIASPSALQRHMGLLEVSGGQAHGPGSINTLEISGYHNLMNLLLVCLDSIASKSGECLRKAVYAYLRELEPPMSCNKWPIDPNSLGSSSRIKVNLHVGEPSYRLCGNLETKLTNGFLFVRNYRYATTQKSTWRELVWEIAKARDDFFKRRVTLEALPEISPDAFD